MNIENTQAFLDLLGTSDASSDDAFIESQSSFLDDVARTGAAFHVEGRPDVPGDLHMISWRHVRENSPRCVS